MSNKVSSKTKVPGGAFYAGDGLTVDPSTRTVSASGWGGDSGVTTLHIYISAVDKETLTPTFTADKTPKEIYEAKTPTWCIMTFAAGLMGENETSVAIPPAFYRGEPSFGHIYDTDKNVYVVQGSIEKTNGILISHVLASDK